jgi:hypothetical protein
MALLGNDGTIGRSLQPVLSGLSGRVHWLLYTQAAIEAAEMGEALASSFSN